MEIYNNTKFVSTLRKHRGNARKLTAKLLQYGVKGG
jgi:hypothetical protein